MKTILIFILALAFTSKLHAQATAIPDPAFEQKLIALGIDTDGFNGQILNSDAMGVDSLDLTNSNISSLVGIGAFVDLTYLLCRYNYNTLTSLDMSANLALTTLDCYSNSLTSLNVSANTALTTLRCSNNGLASLNVSANTALTTLECNNNGLTSLNISANTALTTLVCGTNNLTNLDVSNNLALINLYCDNNNIFNLNINNNTALEKLGCGMNSLTSLNLNANTALRTLNCSFNNLTTLDVSTNTALTVLDCYQNNITSLDVNTNTALTALYCSNNSLTSLDVSTNTALTALYCSNNSLTSLDVSTNTVLENLECEDNNLVSLDASNKPALYDLKVANNNLTSLNVNGNSNLHIVSCGNNRLENLDISTCINLATLLCTNNNLTKIDASTCTSLYNLYSQNNLPYLKICVPNVQIAYSNSNWYEDASTIYTENCRPLVVTGQVVIDANANCLVDTSEQGLLEQLVKFEKISDGTIFYFTTYDSLGNYTAFLDTGTYIITAIPSGPYWQSCPNTQQVTIDTNYNIQTINWTLQPTVLCPFLEVDISAPFLRMTGGGSYYTVSYCNNGTIAVNNAYVEVDLDADLNFINSTIPVTSQNGTVYTFNLGNIAVGQCGDFQIIVMVDTNALFQQTHCTEVHIYPDSICVPIWSGSIINGRVNCQNDTVFFYIENIGAAMLQPQPYSIIEDNIAMHTGTIQLGAGQSTTIAQAAATGKTYRIKIQQLPGFPALLGDSSFTAAIEGCNPLPNGSFNTGFITQFSNGHSSPFIAVDCQQNRASYDPNDKSAQPEGYGLAHYIENNTALDYKVRFQNTGTDTAFNIVIVDTLSSYVDIASLQMGASSHDYTWMIEDGNVLKVSFLNIMLVDSNANEPLSHGFFRYRIEQKANNPIGTVINNQAAIYFDYNPAILTNTTFHIIEEDFVTLILNTDKIYEEEIKITAFPNPFTNSTTIKVEGKEYTELQLSIFDITGKSVAQKQGYSNNQIELTRGNLQPGIYIYQLQGDGKLIGVGKIVVQ